MKNQSSRKNITKEIVGSLILRFLFAIFLFFMLLLFFIYVMASNGPIRLGYRKFSSMKVSFLEMKGFLKLLALSKFNIGKTFGFVSFVIFRNKDLIDRAKTFLLEEALDVLLFALKGKVL
jgi:hypothetical protein